jgi:transposase-like protein
MSPAASPVCPRCGSTDVELISASRDGETADEILVQRCRRCTEQFTVTSKID